MFIKRLSMAALCAAFAISVTSCSNEETITNDNLSIVSSLDPEDCNDKTEGALSFVKPEATMYICSEGEWIAMSDHEAIQYRCESKELKDKSGFAIICDGDTIGIINNGKDGTDGKNGADGKDGKNGTNGTNGKDGTNGTNGTNGIDGVSADTAAINKSIKDALSSASAKNQEDFDNAISILSSASTRNQNDFDEALKNLSSAADMLSEDINKKFGDAYSSWSEELEDKACAIVDTARDYERAVISVTIKCGDVQTTMEIPFTVVNEKLAKVYSKHVMVRFPVQTSKKTSSEIYEDVWTNFKGGDNAELTVMNLDEKFAPNGKVFLQDLFAAANTPFVTVEETNEKTAEYKIVRLEGDLDITNLSTPFVKLRVKLNLTDNTYSVYEEFASSAADVIYNAYADLSEESDTIVIDFLTDYKAARVKNLIDGGSEFAVANKQANKELANALYLEKEGSKEYPMFENYAPNQIGLAENFNSIVWVMALINQQGKTPGFNKVYNAFRNVFAEKGNFNTAIATTYAGVERSMFFVDYLALLIDANFFKQNYIQHGDFITETNSWSSTDAVYYKFVQNGFKDAYKLDASKAKDFKESNYSSKVYKSTVEGGYFRYFEYLESDKIWYPITLWAAGIATAEKVCDTETANTNFLYTYDGIDENAVCVCNNGECGWQKADNVCVGRNEGDKGSTLFTYEYKGGYTSVIAEYKCVEESCMPSDTTTCDNLGLVPEVSINSSSSAASSSSNGKDPKKIVNETLGTCNAENIGVEKSFDIKNAELATTTGNTIFWCNGKTWVEKTPLGVCTETVMRNAEVKYRAGTPYKCDYLDGEGIYAWIFASEQDVQNNACHYGNADQKVFSANKDYICETDEELDDNDNHIHNWHKVSLEQFLGTCDEDLMYDQETPVMFNNRYYKCDCIDGSNYKWVDAETDQKIGYLCLHDRSSAGRWIYPDTVGGNKFDYYLCTVNDNKESEWIKLDNVGYCNLQGENLKLNGVAKKDKFICKYNDEYYYKDASSNSNATWISVNEYCGKPNGTPTAPTNAHAVNNSCVFPISAEVAIGENDTTSLSDDAETTLYYSYDNSVYFTYTEVEKGEYGWDFTALVKFYCPARTGRNVKGAKCWFENEIHTYNFGWN